MTGEREDPLSTGNGRICLLKIIATQAEGLEYSSAFSYKERSRIDYPLTVDDIFSCLGDFFSRKGGTGD